LYQDGYEFDWEQFYADIPPIVRAMDNIIDRNIYPLPEQEVEAKSKRRMGLGITGFANTSEILGMPYGGDDSLMFLAKVLIELRNEAYTASINLAKERGPFDAYVKQRYMSEESFIGTLPCHIRRELEEHGIRNSHLLSVAPTGTISLSAGNVSSGIEPPFVLGEYDRGIFQSDGSVRTFNLMDYAELEYGIKGLSSEECSMDHHVDILTMASKYVDSSVSKTCNVGPDVTFEEFQEVYMKAYRGGASGLTTFRPSGKRVGIMKKATPPEDGAACIMDEQGNRTCD
jgi:ribonucleoside-diphosphate reductase alpha chain